MFNTLVSKPSSTSSCRSEVEGSRAIILILDLSSRIGISQVPQICIRHLKPSRGHLWAGWTLIRWIALKVNYGNDPLDLPPISWFCYFARIISASDHQPQGSQNITNATDPILSIKNLSIELPKGADRQYAVRDVSLDLHRGEILCVVGESSSGKSVMTGAIMNDSP